MSKSAATWLRWLALALLLAIALLQLRLWTGTGGMPDVWRLENRVARQAEENEQLKRRNAALAADVEDLKTGSEAVEERARSELGMTKPGEVFYQVVEPQATDPAQAPPGGTP